MGQRGGFFISQLSTGRIDNVTTVRYHGYMATIQIRIDKKTKRSAKRVLSKLGLDMSTAIKAYLKQISASKGIPFRFVTENGLTPAEEKAVLKASKEASQGKNIRGPFRSVEELIKDLKKPQ